MLAAPVLRPIRTQTVNVGATSTQTSVPIGSGIMAVRIVADAALHYAVGRDPVATTGDALLPALVVERVKVQPGDRVAVIRRSEDGEVWVTEESR